MISDGDTQASQTLDEALMARAVRRAEHSRLLSPPNPWVGAVLVAADGTSYEGGTQRPGQRHAERVVLDAAGSRAQGATLYTTLEPCNFTGLTGPCSNAVIEAGVGRVVVGVEDPDIRVAGHGVAAMRQAGIDVEVGVGSSAVVAQLKPYLHHRKTGRPWVVLKMAATLDGRTAASDGTSQWITGPEARADAHLIRAKSDAILVGAGTVRADNPRLNVRDVLASDGQPPREPLRVVLGKAPPQAAVHPCLEMSGDLGSVLDDLGARGIVQLMVEGGAAVAGDFHRAGFVDSYVVYLAPAIMGGDDGTPLFRGRGASSIAELVRGQIVDHTMVGSDLRITVEAG